MDKSQLAIFENYKIRRYYDEKEEVWYFSIIDIILVLTESNRPRKYWDDLKRKLKDEGSELSEKIGQLKMLSSDGKYYLTDVANPEIIFRLIQAIPSSKAEPLKLWLAKVGYERIQEMTDPERSINRARENWQKHGRSNIWIQQRMMGQEIRNKLTDYWKNNEVKERKEYAILTNIIHKEWSSISVQGHKKIKGLKTQNLRDHMSDAELVFMALAELSTRQIAETMKTKGLEQNKIPAKKGGNIAKRARKSLEAKTGKKVVTGKNFLLQKKK
jgi:DNA-damage-inducible protein D